MVKNFVKSAIIGIQKIKTNVMDRWRLLKTVSLEAIDADLPFSDF